MYRLHRISSVKLKVSSRSTENVGKRRGKSNSTPSLSEEGNDFISGARRDVVWDFLSLPLRFCSLLGFPSDATLRGDRKGPGNPELARNRLSYLREKGASNSESSKRECPHEIRKGTCSKGWGREKEEDRKIFRLFGIRTHVFRSVSFAFVLFELRYCQVASRRRSRMSFGLWFLESRFACASTDREIHRLHAFPVLSPQYFRGKRGIQIGWLCFSVLSDARVQAHRRMEPPFHTG